jgi:hypothetical protein
MPDLIDPLADLKAEIAAEDAAAQAAAPPEPEPAEEDAAQVEEAQLAEAEAAQAQAAEAAAAEPPEQPAPKRRKKAAAEDRMVPVERLNEYAVKVRQLEKTNEELERKLNPPPELTPQQLTEAQIRADARAHARLEIQLEAFQEAGNARYTQEAFDAACAKIAKLINGPSQLVAVAIEATGTPKDASTAIMTLGSMDAPNIAAFLQLSQIKQAAQLSKWATARPKRAADDEAPPRRRQQIEQEEEELEPITPLQGATRVDESLGDEVPPEVWFERFEKQVMNKGRSH